MKLTPMSLILLSIISITQLHAQGTIQPKTSSIDFDKHMRPCIQVNIDPETKTLKGAWKDYLKDKYDFKLRGFGLFSNKDILSAEEITVKQISPKTLDFYTQIIEDENGSEMKVFARHGYDIYIDQVNYPTEYAAIHEMIDAFLISYLPVYYSGQINDTKKRIEELSDKSEDLKEEIEDDTEKIAELKKEIKELEEESESNKALLQDANLKLIKSNEKLERVKMQLKNL